MFNYCFVNSIDHLNEDKMKLTKDMFEAGDMRQRSRSRSEQGLKFKKRRKSSLKPDEQYKIIQNEEESNIKRENMSILDDQNNSVIIWSISDNIFPKVFY